MPDVTLNRPKLRRRNNGSPGGRAVPAHKRAFAVDHELAATAGRKGGASVRPGNHTFSRNPELARAAARARWDRVRVDAAASRGTDDDSHADRHESPESYFGVSGLFKGSHL